MCDCTCSNVMCMLNFLSIKPKKIFECFISFWKWFWYFCVFSFCSKCNFVFFFFFSKTGSEVFLRLTCDLELLAKFSWGKLKSHIFIQKLSLLPREYFVTKLFLRNVFRKNWNFLKFIQRLSRLRASCESFSMSHDLYRDYLTRKKRVFSFYVADVTFFQNS